MKYPALIVLLLIFNSALFAQNLPVIHATSELAYIIEDAETEPREWYLTPSARPDVYELDVSLKATSITFCTDQDTLKRMLLPGQHYDFVVILNGIDSCFNRLEHAAPVLKFRDQFPATHDTIPFVLTPYNNLKIKAVLNQKDTLDLKFDSGAHGLMLTREAIKEKTSLLKDTTVALPVYRALPGYSNLQLGNLRWDSMLVVTAVLSGQGTDGRFGWDLFDGRVVEINYDQNWFIVHSSLDAVPAGYEAFEMEHKRSFLRLNGTLSINGEAHTGSFLFDNGYQRAILLDSTLMQAEGFPKDLPVIKTTSLRDGAGKVYFTNIVRSEMLQVGDFALNDIPTQILTQPNPAGFHTHFFGNELLMRFNTILDFQTHQIFLQPNGLWEASYADAK